MEYAQWNGKQLSATEVGKEYEYEKEVRRASRNKELLCQDPTCHNRALKYCHGKIKLPYFAHIEKAECDYATYENGRSEAIFNLCNRIYDVLNSKGFLVEKEKKLLRHHYSHLVIADEDGTMTALEILKKSLNVKEVDELLEEYQNQGIQTTWIELGNVNAPVIEKQTFFAERFALNEGNRILVIVDRDLNRVAQYRIDPNRYEYRGVNIFPAKEPLCCIGEVGQLSYENHCIQIEGSEAAYQLALAERKEIFQQESEKMDMRETVRREKWRNEQKLIAQRKKIEQEYHPKIQVDSHEEPEILQGDEYDEIRRLIDTADYVMRDSKKRRIVKCKYCGRIGVTDDFVMYGEKLNFGKCNVCARK